jgi:hypothetical protein
MPRRPATIERDIPLFLIPHVVLRGVRTHGEELERVIVSKTRSHFYNVSIRTRPVKRELKAKQAADGATKTQNQGNPGGVNGNGTGTSSKKGSG